jgi:hypothetical protein
MRRTAYFFAMDNWATMDYKNSDGDTVFHEQGGSNYEATGGTFADHNVLATV